MIRCRMGDTYGCKCDSVKYKDKSTRHVHATEIGNLRHERVVITNYQLLVRLSGKLVINTESTILDYSTRLEVSGNARRSGSGTQNS